LHQPLKKKGEKNMKRYIPHVYAASKNEIYIFTKVAIYLQSYNDIIAEYNNVFEKIILYKNWNKSQTNIKHTKDFIISTTKIWDELNEGETIKETIEKGLKKGIFEYEEN
jgi:hypothetical protein